MRYLLPLILTVTVWTPSTAFPSDSPTPVATLADLETRAPKENSYPNFSPDFHQEVIRLVESDTLESGDDFFRAAQVASGPFEEYRSVRIRYELVLAAVAKKNHSAESFLPFCWDSLLRSLGRPVRLDDPKSANGSTGSDDSPFDPAPKAIQDAFRHPADARDAASKTTDNPEIQKIVDADQAIRANWNKLSAEELKGVGANDHQRNVRIREIVKEGGLHTPKDFANASLVMQHSSGFAGYELAHELAVCSMLLGDQGTGRWLVAATYDRMLESVGHDQRFGTQGAITLAGDVPSDVRQVDESGICDKERVALGCPTLGEKRGDLLVSAAWTRIEQSRYVEAEAFARLAMAKHAKAFPDGDWRLFRSRRVLGRSLVWEKRFSEAEPLLLSAYEVLKENEAVVPPLIKGKIRDMADSLVKLYEATDQPQKVSEWKQRIADFDRTSPH